MTRLRASDQSSCSTPLSRSILSRESSEPKPFIIGVNKMTRPRPLQCPILPRTVLSRESPLDVNKSFLLILLALSKERRSSRITPAVVSLISLSCIFYKYNNCNSIEILLCVAVNMRHNNRLITQGQIDKFIGVQRNESCNVIGRRIETKLQLRL